MKFYEELHDLLHLTPKKGALYVIRDRNEKVGSQEIPELTGKFGLVIQNEVGQRLTDFCHEKAVVIANADLQQNTSRLYPWSSPDGQKRRQIDYIPCG